MCSVNADYDLATLDAGLLDAFSPESIAAKASATQDDLTEVTDIIADVILPAFEAGKDRVTLSYRQTDVLSRTGVIPAHVFTSAIRFDGHTVDSL